MTTTIPEGDLVRLAREKLRDILEKHDLMGEKVSVRVGVLTPEEAIGRPLRRDFPIVRGVEKLIEARFRGARGHAFTDAPAEFVGPVEAVLQGDMDRTRDRAVFVAVLNAVMRSMGMVAGTVHCRDEEPEECAVEIAGRLYDRGVRRVALVGLNPAIAEALSRTFGAENVAITDLNPDNIGGSRFGVTIRDGASEQEAVIAQSDLLLVTGTTLVNGTLEGIRRIAREHDRPLVLYGVTCAGIAELFGLERICPYGHDE